MLGIHTINHYNKELFNLVLVGETLQHERYHKCKSAQPIICSVVNKDFVHKDQDQDKNSTVKDQDQDQDLPLKD